jgi:hypothetical protein
MVALARRDNPGAGLSQIEARARGRLAACRQALREKQGGMIKQERDRQRQRDAAIRLYVAALQPNADTSAAA